MSARFGALAALALSSACATTTSVEVLPVTSAEVAVHRRPPPPGKAEKPAPLSFVADGRFAFVDGKTGAALTVDDVNARVRAHRVVVVGEQHDQLAHHEAQRRVIELAAATGPGLAVGFEMLTWDKQATLDRLNRGELDVPGFAEAVDWKKTWGFDFGLYRGIFQTSHEAGARLIALNAPKELVRALRMKGVSGLNAAEVSALPELDLGDALHRAWFEGIFRSAGHPLKAEEIDGFYRAQVLWDESMADRTARAIGEGARQVVVIAGAGHVAAGRGIPQRVERRLGGERVLTILPLTVDSESAERAIASALANADADILMIPRFEAEVVL